MLSPDATSLEVKDVLQCDDEEAKNHLKTFFEVMNTSSQHVTYTSGTQQGPGEVYGGSMYGVGGELRSVWCVGRGCASYDSFIVPLLCPRESAS